MKYKKLGKLCLLASASIAGLSSTGSAQDTAPQAEPAEPQKAAIENNAKTDFIRVRHTEKNVYLQTSVTRYSKENVTVDLIGAVHIADESYYDQLNKVFTNYEVLLFEMVGGEGMKKVLKGDKKQPVAKKDAQMNFLSGMYETMMKKLDLAGQKDKIDYSKDNFVHADLTMKEFNDLQKKKGESLLKIALKSALQANDKGAKQPSTIKLLKAMIFGTPNDIKLTIVDTLGGGDDQVEALMGKNSVIIGDRNIKCLKVMNEQIAAGKTNIGIFYGAAHFPDMEKRMMKMGFKQTKHSWLNAWKLDKKIKAKNKKAEKKAA